MELYKWRNFYFFLYTSTPHLGIGSVVLEFNMFRDTESGLRSALSIKDTNEISQLSALEDIPRK